MICLTSFYRVIDAIKTENEWKLKNICAPSLQLVLLFKKAIRGWGMVGRVRIRLSVALLTSTKFSFSSGESVCTVDEERAKKPLGIGTFMKEEWNWSAATVHFYLHWIAGIYYTTMIRLLITISVHVTSIIYFIAYSCSQHSSNPWLLLVIIIKCLFLTLYPLSSLGLWEAVTIIPATQPNFFTL